MPKGVDNHKSSSKEANTKRSTSLLKFHRAHPNHQKEVCNTPEAKANRIASHNTPEILELIQQYGSPLINKLRIKYYHLEYRCNNPNHPAYNDYGGRGIQNLFISQFNFLSYAINELHITQFSQIDGLQIDRIDNNGNYEPGNIRFVTLKVNSNNRRNNSN